MGVTTKDIARICGVSRGTVDRALNGKDRINPKTKEMILNKAQELGYRPDLLARSLVKGKSMTIGVIVFDLRNRYFSQMVNTIEIRARENGYFTNITLQENDCETEVQLIHNLVDRKVDGLLICPVNKGEAFNQLIRNLKIPIVVIGNKISDDHAFVCIDERKAAGEAIELIVSKGYEEIIFVCPTLEHIDRENIYSHEQRLLGFQDVMKKHKEIKNTLIDHWGYLDVAENMVLSGDHRMALFCTCDTYALDIMMRLKSKDKLPPRDYGIMGFDGIDTLKYITPALATVYNSVNEVGEQAVDMLLNMINGSPHAQTTILSHRIITGESL